MRNVLKITMSAIIANKICIIIYHCTLVHIPSDLQMVFYNSRGKTDDEKIVCNGGEMYVQIHYPSDCLLERASMQLNVM